MKVRKVLKKDIKQIVSILEEVSKIHVQKRPDVFKDKQSNEIEKDFLKELKDKEKIIRVAVNGTKVEGIVIFKIKEVKDHINLKNSKILWIEELGVKQESRRKGIGKQLIIEAKKISKNCGCTRMELNCWECNEDAIKFYENQEMLVQRRIFETKI